MSDINDQHEESAAPSDARVAETVARASVPQTRAILRVLFVVLAFLVVGYLVKSLANILLLLVASSFFAYLLAPLVELLHRPWKTRHGRSHALPRVLAIVTVYALLLGTAALAGYLLFPKVGHQLTELSNKMPSYLTSARARSTGLNSLYQRYHVPAATRTTLNHTVEDMYSDLGNFISTKAKAFAAGAVVYLPWLVLVPVLAFFLLKDADEFRNSALQALPRGRVRWRGRDLFEDLNSTLAAYVRAQLLGCLIVGTVISVGFAVLRVPYALVLGPVGGALEFIPMVGPFAFIGITLALCMVTHSGTPVWGVLIFLAAVRMLEDYVILPRILKRGIHLHPLAVILAILCGAELDGVTGVFLAIPVVAILTTVHRHWLQFRGSEGLVADLLQPVEKAVTAPPSEPEHAHALESDLPHPSPH